MMVSEAAPPPVALACIVARIERDDPTGISDLYKICADRIRRYLRRQVGEHAEDLLHDTLLDVVVAIRSGHLREHVALLGFAWGIARRKAMRHNVRYIARNRMNADIDTDVEIEDPSYDLERATIKAEQVEFVRRYLAVLPEKDREILTRFYVHSQSPEQIQRELNLSPTQFRLTKSRAKARFAEFVRRRARVLPPKRVG